jgi:hypothetical protein
VIPLGFIVPALALLGVGVLLLASHQDVVTDVLGALGVGGRGARVGRATTANALGVIPDDPQALADSAGLDLPTYALARLIASEEGNSPVAEKVAVGWAAWNAHGAKLADVLTSGKGDADEHFKAQGYSYTTGPTSTGRAAAYASTAQDPHEDDVRIATGIIAGTIADPTGGATNFFRPGLQDEEFAQGKVTRDGAAVIAEWTAGGLSPVTVPGIDPGELAFFRKGTADG